MRKSVVMRMTVYQYFTTWGDKNYCPILWAQLLKMGHFWNYYKWLQIIFV